MRDYHLLVASILPLILLVNTSYASQSLPSNYYLYQNVSVQIGDQIIVSLNASGNMRLIIMPQSQLSNYANGYSYTSVYNSTVSTGLYQINLPKGNYTTVLAASFGAITLGTWEIVGAKGSDVAKVNIYGTYHYPLSLSNYSNVRVTVVGITPINMNQTDTRHNATFGSVFYGPTYYNITLNKGSYVINFSSRIQTQALIAISYNPTLITPIPSNSSGMAFPVGVSAYGLNNRTRTPTPYVVKTDLIEGGANITSISAYNALPVANTSKYGASLQLNVMMNVDSKAGKHYTYWLQDVLEVNTSNKTYEVFNNIWNDSAPIANMSNSTVRGSGKVYSTEINSTTHQRQKYYVYSIPTTYSYSLPLYFYPVIRESMSYSGNPIVSFGYYAAKGIYYYDNITLNIPASSAYIMVTPFYMTPADLPYDAEYVFGGESSGAVTSFKQMNASLYLYYNSSTGNKSFPAVYTFGTDTLERTTNLATGSSSHGVHVFVGRINLTKSYVYLSSNQIPNATTTISITTTIPTTTINTTSTITNNRTTTYNATSTIYSNGNQNANGTDAIIYAVAGTIGFVFIAYLAFRRLNNRPGTQSVQRQLRKTRK